MPLLYFTCGTLPREKSHHEIYFAVTTCTEINGQDGVDDFSFQILYIYLIKFIWVMWVNKVT